MAKGYWIARMTVVDETRYKKYVAANGAVFEKVRRAVSGPWWRVGDAARR
jgi:uncharacterized protein (DUF1330 family)